jgi:ribosome-associated protein
MIHKPTETNWLHTVLDDAKAKDISILDVRRLTSITDIMAICTGTSNRHLQSIASKLAEQAKAAGNPPLSVEGEPGTDWILVDLGDAIVHIMLQETRTFYALEQLWSEK